MDPELSNEVIVLGPVFGAALLAITGIAAMRWVNSRNAFMRGRDAYVKTGNIDDLHPDDGLRQSLKNGETIQSMAEDIINR